MHYWLLKSEPSAYSIDDLKRERRTAWEGVRNYQARNNLMAMAVGDLALFYHSSTKEPAVVGLAKIATRAHPDETQFTSTSEYYEPRATKEKPIWFCPDVAFVEVFSSPVLLSTIKADAKLRGIALAQTGSRLSVQPLSKAHFDRICALARR